MKQINNIRIKHIYGKPDNWYHVITPDGRILEEFSTYGGAVEFCKNTKDFLVKKIKNLK